MPDRTVTDVVDREYLELRAKVLEIAASFDRIARAAGNPDPRLEKIHAGIAILSDNRSEKAKRVQELFSQDYDSEWRHRFNLKGE